ncbi:MAG: hypothetical protein H0W48_00450 [Methylibium sp.]|nr:hypothetical protein [Methylibium sp.]
MQPDRFHRVRSLVLDVDEAEAKRDSVIETGHVRMVASTDAPVDVRIGGEGWQEILLHDGPDNVSTDACRTLLYHHNEHMPIGIVRSIRVGGGQMAVEAEIDEYAKLVDVDVMVRRAVASGMIAGVSIGYVYDIRDCDIDRQAKTLRVRRWRCTEVTLTPVPADEAAYVRSLDPPASDHPAAPAASMKGIAMSDPIQPQDSPAAATETPNPAEIIKAERSRAKQIASHARSLGLNAEDYADLDIDMAKDRMLADVAKQRAVTPVAAPIVEVVAEESDNVADHFACQIVSGRSALDVARAFVARKDHKRAATMERGDLAEMVFDGFGKRLGGSRAALVSSGFPQVAGLAAQKVMQGGFDRYDAVYPLLAKEIIHGDFKAVRAGGLDFGDFAEVAEGSAALDATLAEAGGTGANTWRARIIEISLQAVYNDELNLFLDNLGNLGYAGHRSLDKVVQAAIQGATWTNATGILAFSEANLDAAWATYAASTSASGEKLGVRPRRLLTTSAQYVTAHKAVTVAAGESTARVFAQGKAFSLMPVEGAHLTTAGAWYLLADPNEAAAVSLIRHPDYLMPALVEIDAGATPARKFRIDFPHNAFVSTMGTGKPTAARRFTAS